MISGNKIVASACVVALCIGGGLLVISASGLEWGTKDCGFVVICSLIASVFGILGVNHP